MNAKLKNGKLIIELDLQEAKPSASGTTLVVAGTKGRWQTAEKIDGQPLWIIADAFIYPTSGSGPGDKKQDARDSQKKGPKAVMQHEKSTLKGTNQKRNTTEHDVDVDDEDD
jgi:hypothetical protein